MSAPLDREHPLWELWIADRLDDGRLAVVGKAHHCMVDGVAVELAALMLDPSPDPPPGEPDGSHEARPPGALELVTGAVADRVREPSHRVGVGLDDLGIDPERHAVHGHAAVDGVSSIPSRALYERADRAHHIVAIDTEVQRELIPGGGRDAHQGNAAVARNPGARSPATCRRPLS